MTLAFDAVSNPTPGTTDPMTWTHTPVGTPRAVVVFINTSGSSGESQATDEIDGTVSYGGVAMTEVALSPGLRNAAGGSNDTNIHCFFLGASIPTGAQTVSIAHTGQKIQAACITLTAAADTEVEDTSTISQATSPYTVTLTTSVTTFVLGGINHASAAAGNLSPDTGMTERYEVDVGDTMFSVLTSDASPVAAGSPTVSWTGNADDAVAIGVAIKEAAANAAKLIDPRLVYGRLVGGRLVRP